MFDAFWRFVTDICKLHPSHTLLMGFGWEVDAVRSGRVTLLPGRKALIRRGCKTQPVQPRWGSSDKRDTHCNISTKPVAARTSMKSPCFIMFGVLWQWQVGAIYHELPLKVREPVTAFIWACTVCSQTVSQTLGLISGSATWLLKDCLWPWRRYLSTSTVLTGKQSFSLCPPGFCECLNVGYIFGQILTI